MTQQILAYSRKQFLQPEVLDLNQFSRAWTAFCATSWAAAWPRASFPRAGLKAVQADAGQIEQVIVNMAINARDAMPNGGKLLLETSNVTIQQDSPATILN